ncbi:ComEA family DNA-binding protein [Colwellia sp. MEBiC06753]
MKLTTLAMSGVLAIASLSTSTSVVLAKDIADKIVDIAPQTSMQIDSPININQASVEQLVRLKGIGLKKAQAIVEFREANGAFNSVDDLTNVKGIGEKIVIENREMLSI